MTPDETPDALVIRGRVWTEDDDLGDVPEADLTGNQTGGVAL